MSRHRIAFGPVPSRRLGASLGVNNIPPKHCSYSCIYCQAGRTAETEAERRHFFDPEDVYAKVREKYRQAMRSRVGVDYITFVPDGEPTLDINLGKEIRLLKDIGPPIAVITNSSLLWREDVRQCLEGADLVSVKVDATDVSTWMRVNQPHAGIDLGKILEGIADFAESYRGSLISETMIVGGLGQGIRSIAAFLGRLRSLERAYISMPTRPPAEDYVATPTATELSSALRIFEAELGMRRVAMIAGHEGEFKYSGSGDLEGEILGITAVHPMSGGALMNFLIGAGGDFKVVERLVAEGKLEAREYRGQKFFVRKRKQGK